MFSLRLSERLSRGHAISQRAFDHDARPPPSPPRTDPEHHGVPPIAMKIWDSFWGKFWLFRAFLCLRAGLFPRVRVCSACGDESVRHGECADDVRLCYPLTIHPFLSVLVSHPPMNVLNSSGAPLRSAPA